MFGFLKKKPKKPKKLNKPKYRLVPNYRGTYNLESWHNNVSLYLTEAGGINITSEDADKLIKNLDRDIMYYREEE